MGAGPQLKLSSFNWKSVPFASVKSGIIALPAMQICHEHFIGKNLVNSKGYYGPVRDGGGERAGEYCDDDDTLPKSFTTDRRSQMCQLLLLACVREMCLPVWGLGERREGSGMEWNGMG